MPVKDEEVSVSSVIGVASAKENSGSQGSAVEKPAAIKPNRNGPSKRPGASDCKERIARLNQAHRMEVQGAKAKYREELKSMRDALNEQAKKSKEALRQATDGSKKFYEAQLKQIRTDYQNQNDALRSELKKLLEYSVKEIAENAEVRLSNDTNERLDDFRQMIHDEFIDQMQKKADEIEQLRAQLEGKLAVTSQESQGRGHRITQLESRLKEVSHYLPDDIQQEIYEQFGFEDEVIELDEEPKEKRKGLFGRLASAL